MAWDYLKYYSQPIPGIKVNESELRVDYPNGARIQLAGADNWLALKGQYFDYAICDEYAQWQPGAWSEAIRPALADREGGACFIGTPRGHNEFYELYERARDLPDWGRVTHSSRDSGVLKQTELDALRREMSEEEYEQELECSWEAAIRGAYYGKVMGEEKRVIRVPYDETLEVHTSWDLGMRDYTVIVFWQVVGSEVRAINCKVYEGTGLPTMVKDLQRMDYQWGRHFAPHDIKVRELGTGKSRYEVAQDLGLTFDVVKNLPLMDGIEATRSMLKRSVFDEEACAQLVEALKQYRTEWDDKLRCFKNNPLHDWTSHFADAVRMFALSYESVGSGGFTYNVDYSQLDRAVV